MKILSLFLFLSINFTFAHEGHDHDAPKGLLPLKGGIIKPFHVDGKNEATCFVEVAKSKTELKIYFFDSTKKLSNAKDFDLKVTAIPYDRKKKSIVPLTLVDNMSFYSTSFDKKNSHKFDLILKFTGPAYCKTSEEITFVID